ncbi:MAG TPA: bifunctional chorismate mutase/prephenate dehydratase [Candidatus Alectryocaccobium stercorigallinarum]|nr:bifunctional chorismate mutase/prephenate dehydratase [Candidatus Alectryocaccobium stercorigallinarum]
MKIAYSGIEGAFAHIAAKQIYPNEELKAYKGFREAYCSVVSGECSAAVIPIENSFAGEVGQVTDLMFSGELEIDEVYEMHITQNLLGVPGAKISDIKKVISHPQALGQCEGYIAEHDFETEAAVNTARAAAAVAKQNDVHTAAIASLETARLYGLDVIEADINDSKDNTTRFAIFKKKEDIKKDGSEKDGFILLFTVPNIAGGLAKALTIIGDYGFNMSILRSRPMKSLAWNYYFYVEAEGDVDGEYGKEMLARLSFWCESVKIAGRYKVQRSL